MVYTLSSSLVSGGKLCYLLLDYLFLYDGKSRELCLKLIEMEEISIFGIFIIFFLKKV